MKISKRILSLVEYELEKLGWVKEHLWLPNQHGVYARHEKFVIVNGRHLRLALNVYVRKEDKRTFRIHIENEHTRHFQFFIVDGMVTFDM